MHNWKYFFCCSCRKREVSNDETVQGNKSPEVGYSNFEKFLEENESTLKFDFKSEFRNAIKRFQFNTEESISSNNYKAQCVCGNYEKRLKNRSSVMNRIKSGGTPVYEPPCPCTYAGKPREIYPIEQKWKSSPYNLTGTNQPVSVNYLNGNTVNEKISTTGICQDNNKNEVELDPFENFSRSPRLGINGIDYSQTYQSNYDSYSERNKLNGKLNWLKNANNFSPTQSHGC
ncbi:unnamed protein product [Gordionus sp. m RMFG-2023]